MGGGRTASHPVRTCVGCRTRRSVREGRLVRVACGADGSPRLGRTLPGRGAWLCADPDCLELALRRRSLARALRCEIGTEAATALRTGFPSTRTGARDYEAPSRGSHDND